MWAPWRMVVCVCVSVSHVCCFLCTVLGVVVLAVQVTRHWHLPSVRTLPYLMCSCHSHAMCVLSSNTAARRRSLRYVLLCVLRMRPGSNAWVGYAAVSSIG